MKLYVVMGLGQFGWHTAVTLYQEGVDVLAIDRNNKKVERIKDLVGQAVCMDATDPEGLESMQVNRAHAAILGFGESQLEASILCCAALNDLGIGKIIVRSSNPTHGRILKRVGAHRVVYPEKQMAQHLAASLVKP